MMFLMFVYIGDLKIFKVKISESFLIFYIPDLGNPVLFYDE